MFRRAFLSLIPAIAALAFLLGAPADGTSDRSVAARTTESGAPVLGKGSLSDDDVELLEAQWGTERDTPDPVVRPRTVSIWTPPVAAADPADVTTDIHPTHRPCACPPRAPPAA